MVQYYSTGEVARASRPWMFTRKMRVPLNSCHARSTCRLILTIANFWKKRSVNAKGRRVHILAPQRGEKRDMIDLVEKNAKLAFEQRFRVLKPDMKRVLEELQETLELPGFLPASNRSIFRTFKARKTSPGMVVCENGKMNRSEYRKFKIRWTSKAQTMLLRCTRRYLRRYRRVRDEGNPSGLDPDRRRQITTAGRG